MKLTHASDNKSKTRANPKSALCAVLPEYKEAHPAKVKPAARMFINSNTERSM